MRDFKKPPGEGAQHQLLTGGPFPHPMHHVSAHPQGTRAEPVIPLATAEGEVQAALSKGGTGTLKRAGRP